MSLPTGPEISRTLTVHTLETDKRVALIYPEGSPADLVSIVFTGDGILMAMPSLIKLSEAHGEIPLWHREPGEEPHALDSGRDWQRFCAELGAPSPFNVPADIRGEAFPGSDVT